MGSRSPCRPVRQLAENVQGRGSSRLKFTCALLLICPFVVPTPSFGVPGLPPVRVLMGWCIQAAECSLSCSRPQPVSSYSGFSDYNSVFQETEHPNDLSVLTGFHSASLRYKTPDARGSPRRDGRMDYRRQAAIRTRISSSFVSCHGEIEDFLY